MPPSTGVNWRMQINVAVCPAEGKGDVFEFTIEESQIGLIPTRGDMIQVQRNRLRVSERCFRFFDGVSSMEIEIWCE